MDQLSYIHCAPWPIRVKTGVNASRAIFFAIVHTWEKVIGIAANFALISSADASMAFFTIVEVIWPSAAISRIFPIGTPR